MPINNAKGSYTVEEVAIMLDVTRQTVYKLIELDLFVSRKYGTSYRIEKSSFDKWLDN